MCHAHTVLSIVLTNLIMYQSFEVVLSNIIIHFLQVRKFKYAVRLSKVIQPVSGSTWIQIQEVWLHSLCSNHYSILPAI